MKNLWEIGTIKDIMTRHGFQFSKSLGQNFLINPTVCPQMAEYALSDGATCAIEIGAGVGILTAELAKRAKKVISIEVDSALLPVLEETLADFDNVEVINADVLKTDINALIEEKFPGEKVAVCANLPYYITSPIIMYFLENKANIENMTANYSIDNTISCGKKTNKFLHNGQLIILSEDKSYTITGQEL